MLYSLAAKSIAGSTQMEKEQIEQSEEYAFESNWKVFWVSTLILLMTILVAIAVVFIFDAAGIEIFA